MTKMHMIKRGFMKALEYRVWLYLGAVAVDAEIGTCVSSDELIEEV